MDYRARHAEHKLLEYARYFKAVLLTGARQVGKSTLLQHALPGARVLVFDPLQDLYGARSDPDLFLDSFAPPLVLDEIQYAPELLPALKRRMDSSDRPGQYFLSGSQNLAVLESVAESMAGRVGILELAGMTLPELLHRGDQQGWLPVYLHRPSELLDVVRGTCYEAGRLTRVLWRGSLPGLLDLPDRVVPDYLRSYVQTYVERDIRALHDIRSLADFGRFLALNAALTAQEIKDSQLGRDIGVSPPTAHRWRELLVNSYQWMEIPAYHGNTVKRISGKRKGYLRDTGLACSLQRLSSPEALLVSPLLGALFETWVVNQINRQFIHLPLPPQAYHWRTASRAEVDLVLEYDGRLHPIEVKCKTAPNRHDTRGLRAFRETYGSERVMPGLLIHAGSEAFWLDRHTMALPWNAACAPSA